MERERLESDKPLAMAFTFCPISIFCHHLSERLVPSLWLYCSRWSALHITRTPTHPPQHNIKTEGEKKARVQWGKGGMEGEID